MELGIRSTNRFLRDSSTLAAFSGLSVVFSLVADVILLARLGFEKSLDAYSVAYVIPSILMSATLVASNSTLVPLFAQNLCDNSDKPQQDCDEFFSSIVSLSIILGIGIFLAGLIFSPMVISLTAPGFDTQTRESAIRLSRVLYAVTGLMVLNRVCASLFYAFQRFAIPSALETVRTFSAVPIVLFLLPTLGVSAMVLGLAVGAFVQLLFLGIFVRRLGLVHYIPSISITKQVAKAGQTFWIPMIGLLLRHGTDIVERAFASYMVLGSVTIVAYANRITMVLANVFLGSFVLGSLPGLSGYAAIGDWDTFAQALRRAIRSVILVSSVLMVVVIVTAQPLVRFLTERADSNTVKLAQVLMIYTASLVFLGLSRIVQSYFYATLRARWVLVLFLSFTSMTVLFDLVLVPLLQVYGLAVSFLLSAIIVSLIGVILISRHTSRINWKAMLSFGLRTMGTTALAIGASSLVVYVLAAVTSINWLIVTAVCTLLSLVCYTVVADLLGIREVRDLIGYLKHLGHRKSQETI